MLTILAAISQGLTSRTRLPGHRPHSPTVCARESWTASASCSLTIAGNVTDKRAHKWVLWVYEHSILTCHFRPVLSKFIGEMRTANRGCLNSLSYQEVINRVAQLILDHQDSTRVRAPK